MAGQRGDRGIEEQLWETEVPGQAPPALQQQEETQEGSAITRGWKITSPLLIKIGVLI